MKIEKCLGSAIQTAMRKVFKNNLTVKDVRGVKMQKQLCESNAAYQFMNNIRTSPGYAQSCGKRGLAMIRQLGLPTFFFTITSNELSAPELIVQLHKNEINNERKPKTNKRPLSLHDALLLPKEEVARLVREDPTLCVECFNHRSQAFLRYIADKNGPFGKNYSTEYMVRKEAQGRGTLHYHGMSWNNDAPIPDLENGSNFEEVSEFIDKYITCEYNEDNPNMRYHIHKCNRTCYKGKEGRKDKSCRFHFPKFVSPKTKILLPLPKEKKTNVIKKNLSKIKAQMDNYRQTRDEESFEDMLRNLEITEENYYEALQYAIDKPTVFYKRQSNAVSVNTYNKHVMNAWEGNTDLQFILEPYSAIKYLFEYCFKT